MRHRCAEARPGRLAIAAAAVVSLAASTRGAQPGPSGHDQRELSVPLVIAGMEGCVAHGPSVTLLDKVVTQENDITVFEAEDAAAIVFAPALPGRRAVTSEPQSESVDGGGAERGANVRPGRAIGKYIDHVTSARWIVKITKPGTYMVWYRYWVPSEGPWTHVDQKDHEGNVPLMISARRPGEWFWQSGHPSYYRAGVAELSVSSIEDGPRLDRLALVPSNISRLPEGGGLPATPALPVNGGVVTFEPLSSAAAGVVKWDRLELDADARGGSITFEASGDGGNSWRRLEDALNLSALPASGGELLVRARLARAGTAAPVLSNVRCRFVARADAFLAIANQFTRLTFSRADGSLCGIEDLQRGEAVAPVGLPGAPFALGTRRPDAEKRIEAINNPAVKYDIPKVAPVPFAKARLTSIRAAGRRVDAEWAAGDVIVRLSAALEEDSPLAAWTITVINNSRDTDVLQVVSPIVSNLRLGETSQDDRCAWPYQSGEFVDRPASLGERVLTAGTMGIGFVDLFDQRGGFYLGNHTAVPIVTDLASNPDSGGDRIELSYTKHDRIKAGGGSATYTYLLGPHAGDWHWAARQYRGFFLKAHTMKEDAVPKWLADADGWWVTGMGLPQPGMAQRHYDEFRSLRVSPLLLGMRAVQFWGSTFDEACPDYYLPRNECGGAEALARNMADWRSIGGIAGHYIHGTAIGSAYAYAERYFDRPWSDYAAADRAPDEAFHRRNELFTSPTYRPQYATWPSLQQQFQARLNAQRWGSTWLPNPTRMVADYHRFSWEGGTLAEFLAKWTERYVRDYHSSTIYYDTLSFGATPEFNPYLGCNGEGTATVNRVAFLQDTVARMRAVNPDFACMVEGASDVYTTVSSGTLGGFSRDPEILRYTLPRAIFFEGQSNGQWSAELSDRSLKKSFINGNRLDIMRLFPAAHEVLRLRQRLSPWFNGATFDDTEGLQFDANRLQARVHVVEQPGTRGVLIALRNDQRAADALVRYTLPEGMKVNAVHCFQQGAAAPFKLNYKLADGVFNFIAPAGDTSGVVLVDEAAGQFAWTAIPRQSDANAVALDVYSYATRPIRLDADVKGQHVPMNDGRRGTELEPGQLATIHFSMAGASPDPWIEPVILTLSGDGYQRVQLAGIARAAPNGSFEASFEPQTTDAAAYDGKRLHFGVPGTFHANELALVPGKTYRLTVAVRGNPKGLSVFYAGDGRAAPGRSNGLTKARTDRGWDIYETIVTAGETNTLSLHAGQATGLYYYDAIRADMLGGPGRGSR